MSLIAISVWIVTIVVCMNPNKPWGAHYTCLNRSGIITDVYYLKKSESQYAMITIGDNNDGSAGVYDMDESTFESYFFIGEKCVFNSISLDDHLASIHENGDLKEVNYQGNTLTQAEIVKDGKIVIKMELSDQIENIHPFGFAYDKLSTLPLRIEDQYGVFELVEIIIDKYALNEVWRFFEYGVQREQISLNDIDNAILRMTGLSLDEYKEQLNRTLRN